MSDNCGNCRYFEKKHPVGQCRRRAPIVSMVQKGDSSHISSDFPEVPKSAWCGEHDQEDRNR